MHDVAFKSADRCKHVNKIDFRNDPVIFLVLEQVWKLLIDYLSSPVSPYLQCCECFYKNEVSISRGCLIITLNIAKIQ